MHRCISARAVGISPTLWQNRFASFFIPRINFGGPKSANSGQTFSEKTQKTSRPKIPVNSILFFFDLFPVFFHGGIRELGEKYRYLFFLLLIIFAIRVFINKKSRLRHADLNRDFPPKKK